jgi:ABC-type polysaccharide/polyol phosphate transport system ATPase subunit
VVLVSHEPSIIRELCDEVLWLEKGKIRMIGETDVVMNAYHDSQMSQ